MTSSRFFPVAPNRGIILTHNQAQPLRYLLSSQRQVYWNERSINLMEESPTDVSRPLETFMRTSVSSPTVIPRSRQADSSPLCLCLITCDPTLLTLLYRSLPSRNSFGPIRLETHTSLLLPLSSDQPIDLLLLDEASVTAWGPEEWDQLRARTRDLPLLLLTDEHHSHPMPWQDYSILIYETLPKSQLTAFTLEQALKYCLTLHRMQQTSITPSSTGATSVDPKRLAQLQHEKELLEHTLQGSIEAMSQVLSLMNPDAFGRSARIKRYVTAMAKHLGLPDIWKLEIAALLSQIGWVALPAEILFKVSRGRPLTPKEETLYRQYPQVGASILRKIPRMDEIAEIIAYQEHTCDQSHPSGGEASPAEAVPLGARLLKVAIDMDALESTGHTKHQALMELEAHASRYDPRALKALWAVSSTAMRFKHLMVPLHDLAPPMILAEPIRAKSGAVIVPKGLPVTFTLLTRLHNFVLFQQIQEPLSVLVPVTTLQEELQLEGPSS
ncbi:MAG: hypothetical protein D6704_06575 [Nitrospirae bacterium]|nr:MAG: hypothetical protein D6704_06575 [Nitrospirota bacterium]